MASLIPGMVPAGLIMVTILVYLFNAYRPPIVIVATLPLAMIGITAGLLLFDLPFGFVAILGVLSLSGIMIRNSVVLLETIDREVEEGKSRYQAVIDGTISRTRPVLTAATCAGLGLVPLFRLECRDRTVAASSPESTSARRCSCALAREARYVSPARTAAPTYTMARIAKM